MIPPAAEAARYEFTKGTGAQYEENATRVQRERERERERERSAQALPCPLHSMPRAAQGAPPNRQARPMPAMMDGSATESQVFRAHCSAPTRRERDQSAEREREREIGQRAQTLPCPLHFMPRAVKALRHIDKHALCQP